MTQKLLNGIQSLCPSVDTHFFQKLSILGHFVHTWGCPHLGTGTVCDCDLSEINRNHVISIFENRSQSVFSTLIVQKQTLNLIFFFKHSKHSESIDCDLSKSKFINITDYDRLKVRVNQNQTLLITTIIINKN